MIPAAKDEWYVLLSGYGSVWAPVSVVLGRIEALGALVDNFPITPSEGQKLRAFHEGDIPLGQELLLVGHFDPKGRRINDRKLVRVQGPLRGEV